MKEKETNVKMTFFIGKCLKEHVKRNRKELLILHRIKLKRLRDGM